MKRCSHVFSLASAVVLVSFGTGTTTSCKSDPGPAGCDGSHKVTFRLNVPGEKTYCEGDGACNATTFVTVTDAAGRVVRGGDSCIASCSTCEQIACAHVCNAPKAIAAKGTEVVWDGTYSEVSSCGDNGIACNAPACSSAGNYVATMCAFVVKDGEVDQYGTCNGSTEDWSPQCVDVPFTWPPAPGTVVVGTLK